MVYSNASNLNIIYLLYHRLYEPRLYVCEDGEVAKRVYRMLTLPGIVNYSRSRPDKCLKFDNFVSLQQRHYSGEGSQCRDFRFSIENQP